MKWQSLLRRIIGATRGRPSLLRSQLEFLQYANWRAIDGINRDVWQPIVGSVERELSHFVQQGLLQDASPNVKLACKYRVEDLKPLLRQHGITGKRKKADMIGALVHSLPDAELQSLVAGVVAYQATALGQEIIDRHAESKLRERDTMTSTALSFLLQNDIWRASDVVAQYESQQVIGRGIGFDWCDGMPEPVVKRAEYLLRFQYDDLLLDEHGKRRAGAGLALYMLLGESVRQAATRLIDAVAGDFSCPSLISFLRDHPIDGMDEPWVPNTPRGSAELYVRTRMAEACESVSLKELLAERFGKGVEIYCMEGACETCNRGKHCFRWSEIGRLPRVPRHWCCRCGYTTWW